MHREARGGAGLLDVAGECGTESHPRLDVGTQVEDAQTQFADDASHFGADVVGEDLPLRTLQIGHEDIERVADACQLLGDPVMDLAGQSPPLLCGRCGAHVREEPSGVDPQRCLLCARHRLFESRHVERLV